MSTENTQPIDPEGTIPVNNAIAMAKNWRDFLEASKDEFQGRSFLIPIVDFSNILLYNPTAEAVRAYIGLEVPGDPLSAKLILVPVVDGRDVLYLPYSGTGLGSEGQSNTYDVTKVCPPACATGSEMNE